MILHFSFQKNLCFKLSDSNNNVVFPESTPESKVKQLGLEYTYDCINANIMKNKKIDQHKRFIFVLTRH